MIKVTQFKYLGYRISEEIGKDFTNSHFRKKVDEAKLHETKKLFCDIDIPVRISTIFFEGICEIKNVPFRASLGPERICIWIDKSKWYRLLR